MRHLAYHYGEWDVLSSAWTDSAQIVEEDVSPQSGDTFTDITSTPAAIANIRERGLDIEVLRTSMWGENDYRVKSVSD